MINRLYTHAELRILWFLKKNRGFVAKKKGIKSLYHVIGENCNLNYNAVRVHIANLERNSVVLRTYAKTPTNKFGEGGGNPVVRIELVDPKMTLPALELAPAINMIVENRELEERVISRSPAPTADDILDALLNRVEELQCQNEKLMHVIKGLQDELDKINRQAQRTSTPPAHLSNRLKDALGEDQWQELRRKGIK